MKEITFVFIVATIEKKCKTKKKFDSAETENFFLTEMYKGKVTKDISSVCLEMDPNLI